MAILQRRLCSCSNWTKQIRYASTKSIRTRNENVRKYLRRQLDDEYVKLARTHDYRARSAFKLKELNERLHILKPGCTVLDVGAAPGAWSQVASEYVQPPHGYVLGVDLQVIEPLIGVDFIQRADICDPEVQTAIVKQLGDRQVDCIISDMAPSPTGTKDLDHLRIVKLCRSLLRFVTADAEHHPHLLLSNTCHLVMKLWAGHLLDEFTAEIEEAFGPTRVIKPKASRDNSAELYLCAGRIKR